MVVLAEGIEAIELAAQESVMRLKIAISYFVAIVGFAVPVVVATLCFHLTASVVVVENVVSVDEVGHVILVPVFVLLVVAIVLPWTAEVASLKLHQAEPLFAYAAALVKSP